MKPLSRKSVGALEPGAIVWDHGLGIKGTADGERIAVLDYRLAGRKRRYTIGALGRPWTIGDGPARGESVARAHRRWRGTARREDGQSHGRDRRRGRRAIPRGACEQAQADHARGVPAAHHRAHRPRAGPPRPRQRHAGRRGEAPPPSARDADAGQPRLGRALEAHAVGRVARPARRAIESRAPHRALSRAPARALPHRRRARAARGGPRQGRGRRADLPLRGGRHQAHSLHRRPARGNPRPAVG